MNHSVFIYPNCATNANYTAYNIRCTAVRLWASRLVGNTHPVTPMAPASSSTNYLQRGYVPFSGNPAEFHGWASLFGSIMYEADVGKVMSGTEKAPEAPADSTETTAAAFEKD